jgi:ADP-ribose pyrophosphatase YjhB (NUDIX family)
MKKIIYALLTACLLTACQESYEDRCAREAKEFTVKRCPLQINQNTVIDSMTFDKQSLTVSYYYTLSGPADNAMYIKQFNPRETLFQEVKNSVSLKGVREHGYNIRYVYHSQAIAGMVLFETTYTSDDYNK